MIKSMTGFGRGSAGRSKNKINVEIRTVNSRFFEFKVRGIILEPTIERTVKEYIGSSLERGNVHLLIEYGNLKNNQSMIFNKDRFEKIQNILKDIHIEYGQRLNLSDIISTNDLLASNEVEMNNTKNLMKAIEVSLKQVNEMRISEGEQIQVDTLERLNNLTSLLEKIDDVSKQYSSAKHELLQEKISTLLGDKTLDQNRLIQEVAYFIERADITEEIVRIRSHFNQFKFYLDLDEPVGRRLNFLIQEIGREINTIGSKSHMIEVTNCVIEIKDELEKIREQIQNIV